MKANRKSLWQRQDRAEVGVGTLIVFIAMVLVAAVAAAVLINTSGTLQQRAQKTGESATEQVSSNLLVQGVYGNVSSNKITAIQIHTTLAAGAVSMDLSKVRIRYSDGTNAPVTLNFTKDVAPSATWYRAIWLRENDSTAAGNNVISAGDLVNFVVDLDAIGSAYQLDPRTDVQVRLMPEAGSQIPADFRTPNTYGSSAYITLR